MVVKYPLRERALNAASSQDDAVNRWYVLLFEGLTSVCKTETSSAGFACTGAAIERRVEASIIKMRPGAMRRLCDCMLNFNWWCLIRPLPTFSIVLWRKMHYINGLVRWFDNLLHLFSTNAEFCLQRHLMFPSEFFDDTPTLLTSFVIRNVNGFVSCIGFERSNRFSILEHQIRTAKAKFFL